MRTCAEPQTRSRAWRDGPGLGSRTSRGRETRTSDGQSAEGVRAAVAAIAAHGDAPEEQRPGPCCGQTLTISRGLEDVDQRDSISGQKV